MRTIALFLLLSALSIFAFADEIITQEPFKDPNGNPVFVVTERPTTTIQTLENLLENDTTTVIGLMNAELE